MISIDQVQKAILAGELFTYESFSSKSSNGYPTAFTPEYLAWRILSEQLVNEVGGSVSPMSRTFGEGLQIQVLGNGERFFNWAHNLYLGALKSAEALIASGEYGNRINEAKNRLLVSESEAEVVSDPRSVFVVHGRDENLRKSMFDFLRAIGLKPIEWTDAVRATGSGAPFIGEILDSAMHGAQAIVVLMTPDDEARLRECYLKKSDLDHERNLTPQARPNVLFEAGMAFGRFPDRTLLVEVGELRPFSDVAGRNVIRMSNSSVSRQELANRLKTAGCEVDTSGVDWHSTGDFSVHMESDERSRAHGAAQIAGQEVTHRQLLASMLYNGSRCWHVTQHPRGEFVVVGDRMFFDSTNPELAIDFVVAVNELETANDISYTTIGSVGIEYALTSSGIRKASLARSSFDREQFDSLPESDVHTIDPASGNFL